MPVQFIPFTGLSTEQEHGPDLARLENAIPALGGLRSLPKATSDGVVTDRLHSCYIHPYPSGSGTAAYVGDAGTEFYASIGRIYSYSGATFTNLTGALVFGGTPSARRFATFGKDVWSANFTDPPATRIANAGNFVNAVTSAFVPKARFLGVVREYMIQAALSNGGYFEDQFVWSNSNDAAFYDDKTVSPTSNAGQKRILSRPGQIMGFLGGAYGRFWKRSSIHALQFTASSDIWQMDILSPSVGTPCPNSLIDCRDGVARFWGGDGFYQQAGLGEPTLIPELAGISTLLIDRDAYLNDVSLRPLAQFNDMAEEDNTIFAAEDPELGGVFWFYRGLADDPVQGNNRWIYYNYRSGVAATGVVNGVNFVCATAAQNFLSASTTPPRFLVGAYYDAVDAQSHRFRFQATTFYAITLATQRFSIAQEGAPAWGQRVHVNAIQPLVTPRRATYGTDYRLAPLPGATSFRLVGSNDLHYQQQLDVDGAQVSPVSQVLTFADANDFGWLGAQAEGRSFLLEVSVPEGSTALRGLLGFWIDYSVLGGP